MEHSKKPSLQPIKPAYFLKRRKLREYLKSKAAIDIGDLHEILKAELKDIGVLLFFDDQQKANEDINHFLEGLLNIMKESTGIKAVVAGRRTPQFYDRREVAIMDSIKELRIHGLDRDSSRALLGKGELEEKEFDKIYERTNGHPLALELISATGAIDGQDNMEQYLREEVIQKLSDEERELLSVASIYRRPVSAEALLIHEGMNYEALDDLVDRALIQDLGGTYSEHDLIRDFFYSRLQREIRKRYHRFAAEYYLQLASLSGILEAQHHYLKADVHKEAAALACKNGNRLLDKGYLGECLEILDGIDENKLDSQIQRILLTFKGDIMTTMGKWDEALECFESGLKIAKDLNDGSGQAQAYNKIGSIIFRKGDLRMALDYYDLSLGLMGSTEDKTELSKLYNNIGVANWKLGKLDQAIKNYKNSLLLSEELSDEKGIAGAYNNLGIIYWEKGDMEEAIRFYLNSLEISEKIGDKKTMSILHGNMGEAYRVKGDTETALNHNELSLKLAEELGFRWQMAEVYKNIGKLQMDDKEKLDYFTLAYELFRKLGANKEVEELEDLMKKG